MFISDVLAFCDFQSLQAVLIQNKEIISFFEKKIASSFTRILYAKINFVKPQANDELIFLFLNNFNPKKKI